MAVLFLRGTGGIRLTPLVKSIVSTLAAGGVLLALTNAALSGGEGKLLLVVKCVGLGAAAAALYAGLLLLTRQEDFRELLVRYRKRSG